MSDKPAGTDRRSFLDMALVGGLAAWGTAMAVPTVFFLWPAHSGAGRATTVSAGPAKDFAVGSSRMLQAEGKPVMVIRLAEDLFRAFSPICTHLGCIVKWDGAARKIVCPCHAGDFDTEGRNIAGPPPRPLQPYAVSVLEGEVVVKL